MIGIGGSYLGARAAIEFVNGQMYNQIRPEGTPEVYFAGNNISSSYLNDLVKIVGDRDFCINVISKSGTTTEPALAVQDAAKRRVFCSEMVGGTAVLDTCPRRAFHDLVDVDARRRHRQQTDRRQHGKASADVVRHDEGLVSLIIRKLLERAALLVRGRKDALLRALAAVFLLAKLLEDERPLAVCAG